LLLECQDQVKKIKNGTYVPLPLLAFFGYYLGLNMYAFKIVKSILWGIPFILSFRFRQNVVQNSQALIDSLYLLKCGTKVEIKTVYGNKTIYDIKDVRIPNQMELN